MAGDRCFFITEEGRWTLFWAKCVIVTLCSWSLFKIPIAASHDVSIWKDWWYFVRGLYISAIHKLFTNDTTQCFLRRCLTCSPVFIRHSSLTIFMGKSLVLSQLQSHTEVPAEALHIIKGKCKFAVNKHIQKSFMLHY